MDEGRIKQGFFIGKVSNSLLLVFERDLGTGGDFLILSCLLCVKTQRFLAHWENEKQRVDCKSKVVCYSNDSNDYCKTGFDSRLVTII